MDREISSATWLAVSLIAVSAFIGMVIWTIQVGNVTKRQAIEFGADMTSSLETGETLGLIDTCTDMSMAAIYNILVRNYNNITQLDLYRCTGSDMAITMEDFESKAADESVLVTGTSLTKWRANKKGLWAVDGSATDPNTVLMVYEILMKEGMLSGRGYLTINRLPSDTLRVKILYFNN